MQSHVHSYSHLRTKKDFFSRKYKIAINSRNSFEARKKQPDFIDKVQLIFNGFSVCVMINLHFVCLLFSAARKIAISDFTRIIPSIVYNLD